MRQAATFKLPDKIFAYVFGDINKVRQTEVRVLGQSGRDYLVQGVWRGQRLVTPSLGDAHYARQLNGTAFLQ